MSTPSTKCQCSLSTPGYAAFFLFARLAQPLPNQPPRMGGAELSRALWFPGGASSRHLLSDFLLWLPSSPERRGVAKEKMGSCHLTGGKATSGRSEPLSVTTLPGTGKLSEANCLNGGWALASGSFGVTKLQKISKG